LVAGVPFEQYRDFVRKELPDDSPARLREIANDWRSTTLALLEFRLREPAVADRPEVLPMPSHVEPLVRQVQEDPVFQKAFTVPWEIGLVELDRLVVRQELINLAQVDRIHVRLGTAPSQEQMFRLCMPVKRPTIEHGFQALSDDTYLFTSESNDIRFLESMLVRPEQLEGIQTHGTVTGVLAILVGFGSNYLNAVASDGRLVLNNGSHRAYALRALGTTHVPCVIQKPANRKELAKIAVGGLRKMPDFYLRDPRPPLLKDYFNPRLYRTLWLPAARRQVRVKFTIETSDVVK
jgi:hypothetical protein